MDDLFLKIIAGVIPSHKIYEDDQYFAFLDIRPVNPGHCLVIPKEKIDYIFDLSDELLAGLMICAKNIAQAIKTAIPCKKIGVMVAGLEVPHTHIHLIPIQNVTDLNFALAKDATNEELAEIADRIKQHL